MDSNIIFFWKKWIWTPYFWLPTKRYETLNIIWPKLDHPLYRLGVPATSRILTGDSQRLSFSILSKVPILIFWSDKPPWCANSAYVACSRADTWLVWAEVARRQVCHTMIKFTFLKSSWKIVRNIYYPAKLDEIL